MDRLKRIFQFISVEERTTEWIGSRREESFEEAG